VSDTVDESLPPQDALEERILAMLSIDEESPWILHTALTAIYPGLQVAAVIDTLTDLVQKGWAVSWIPLDDSDDPNAKGPPTPEYWEEAIREYQWFVDHGYNRHYAFDDYGPWFRLTQSGRREHERRPLDYPYDSPH
jgi:hypothetical protein